MRSHSTFYLEWGLIWGRGVFRGGGLFKGGGLQGRGQFKVSQ